MNRFCAVFCALFACTTALGAQTGTREGDLLPDWQRKGVCYEVFVRSFQDSDGDGIGDLNGLIQRLDYINDGNPATRQDLGANCIWLMPIAQSSSYHGYDVTNYYAVDRDYGTNADFERLVAEAHRRGIRVLLDLVLNHSSSEHPFFKSAVLDSASPYRDWYRWSPTQRQTQGWSVPTWHKVPTRDEYYYGLFWHGMPDLNLAHREVRAEAERIARFWLEQMGADGFRLDAVGHFFEDGDGFRHGAGTHAWLREFAAALRKIKPGVFTVGEVWDSVGALIPYYPDQLDAYFAFGVSDALLAAVQTGSRRGLVHALEQVQRELPPGRWASFQRNHDQTRTLTALRGDTARARLAATLLLTLPGFPFVYYGEEIGMAADKPDPRLRTPMHWSREPAAGFSGGLPWEPLQPDSLSANVAAQHHDPGSLLNHYRRMIHLRATHPALWADSECIPLSAADDAVLAYLRRAGGSVVLVVANVSDRRIVQPRISSTGSALSAGRYAAEPLLAGPNRASLHVAQDGKITAWAPLPVLEPLRSYTFELTRNR